MWPPHPSTVDFIYVSVMTMKYHHPDYPRKE
jgi:hypothetical protein